MLILLPPSEGKRIPMRGPALELAAMSFPSLTPTRKRVLDALIDMCTNTPAHAGSVLGLGPTQESEVALNTLLRSRPCAPAIRVYIGVLFDALDYKTLSPKARRRANSRIVISSGLWGLVRPTDLIPGYRLSGGVSLPGLGTLGSSWRAPVSAEIETSRGLIVDLRSSTYAGLGPISPVARQRSVSVRVLQERDGRRTVVSHMNKATKGRIVRSMLESDDVIGSAPDLVAALRDWGYAAEAVGSRIDVIVKEL